MTNIFTALSEDVLDPLQKRLDQEAYKNKRDSEVLAATSIYNEFESELSKSILDQQANYDGSYDLEEANQQRFAQMRDQTLSKIKNGNVRKQVESHLLNYKSRYEINSKTLALGLEKDIQIQEHTKNRSFRIAKINSDPDQYQNVLYDLQQESQFWRADIRREMYDAEASEASENYYYAKSEKILQSRIRNEITQDQFIQEREKLKAFVNDGTTPLLPDKREILSKAYENEQTQLLTKAKGIAQKVADYQFTELAKAVAEDNGTDSPDIATALLAKAEEAYGDDPVELEKAKVKIETALIEQKVSKALKHGDKATANQILYRLSVQQQAYEDAGDIGKVNAYEALRERISQKITNVGKALEDNSAQYTVDSGNVQVTESLIEESQKPPGTRNYTKFIMGIIDTNDLSGGNDKALKFLTNDMQQDYRNKLVSLQQTGDYGQFKKFSQDLINDWGYNIRGISISDNVIKQLGTIEFEKDGSLKDQSPLLAFALKYAANGNDDVGKKLFKAISLPEDYPTGVDKGDVDSSVDLKFAEYSKAFANYPDLLRDNPLTAYKELARHIVSRAGNETAPFKGTKANALVQEVMNLTIEKDYVLQSNPLLNSKIPVPMSQYTENVGNFISNRGAFRAFMKDLRDGNTPIPLGALTDYSNQVKTGSKKGDVDFGDIEFNDRPIEAGKSSGVLLQTAKDGKVLRASFQELGGELKFQQLLNTGVFLPIGDGSKYRLYGYFAEKDKKHYAVTFGEDSQGNIKYLDINKEDIDRTYGPLYRKKALMEVNTGYGGG